MIKYLKVMEHYINLNDFTRLKVDLDVDQLYQSTVQNGMNKWSLST